MDHACARKLHAQLQRAAGGFDEAAQRGEIKVGLALDLEYGRL
jgi:hypothetical protein